MIAISWSLRISSRNAPLGVRRRLSCDIYPFRLFIYRMYRKTGRKFFPCLQFPCIICLCFHFPPPFLVLKRRRDGRTQLEPSSPLSPPPPSPSLRPRRSLRSSQKTTTGEEEITSPSQMDKECEEEEEDVPPRLNTAAVKGERVVEAFSKRRTSD